ncbi:MAG TPA: type II toxin-antitoxin system HicA family toxin [Spirochaetota bacterium]|jgi:predicted RNA binding protein YcfA (HicA-like mRNA interferase family)|nr:MAG: YcfA-like protein [Spirochaetes bacterium ADurb.Bin133]HNZ25740.1 type II toxin-antitoxin system HicA family toxin [Spirochaetota bacterium]HPY87217.1 type II toxin-antitoxin system HicA family toxin [Spirochaetota bacterium]HQB62213.1 type II toxin-antitoxin system HicA family toxin [Spirochaetota bacterium]
MSKFPIVDADTIIRFLKYLGFVEIRQNGSHKFFKHFDERSATVPYHKGEDIGRGLLLKILKDIEIDKETFIEWLTNKL